MGDDFDALFTVRNNLYVGNYAACITEAQKAQPSSEAQTEERDVIMYRAYCAQGKYNTVKSEVTEKSSSALQAVKLFATYMHKKADRADALARVRKMQEDGISMTNPVVACMCATIYSNEKNFEDALRCLKASEETLEVQMMVVSCCLSLDRGDVAKKELKKMTDMNDDATLTQLATGMTNLALGGDKLQDGYYIFQELTDKYGTTPRLLNCQACSHMLQGRYEEADSCLTEAQEKAADDADTLINMIVCAQNMGKPAEVTRRCMNSLQDSFPEHPWVVDYAAKEALFEKHATVYSA